MGHPECVCVVGGGALWFLPGSKTSRRTEATDAFVQSPLLLVKLGLRRVSKNQRSMLLYRTFSCVEEARAQ